MIQESPFPLLASVTILILQIGLFNPAMGQRKTDAVIENVFIDQMDQKLRIRFDVTNARPREYFIYRIKIFTQIGEQLNAETFIGKVGVPVPASEGGLVKEVFWDIEKDGYFFDERIYAEVKAESYRPLRLGKSFAQNLIFPGWGNFEIDPNRRYAFYIGSLAYASLATTFAFEFNSQKIYRDYLASPTTAERNQLLTKANRQRTKANFLIGTTVIIWAASLSWWSWEVRKLQRKKHGSLPSTAFNFSLDPYHGQPAMAIHLNF